MLISQQQSSPSTLPLIPGVWRANQLAISRTTNCSTGFSQLDQELPGAGWPQSTLIELLCQQPGIGEMQLLKPVLTGLSQTQKIALVQPPYTPQAMAGKNWGLCVDNLLWIKPAAAADGLWAAEQILKHGCCGAVIVWQSHIRNEALRRLHLAAQSTDTWLWLMRPLAVRNDASPAPLRLALRPAIGGVMLDIVKRRGPVSDQALYISLADMPASRHHFREDHAPVVVRTPSSVTARSTASLLV